NGIQGDQIGTLSQIRILSEGRLAIPRTNILADIAPENPVAHTNAEIARYRTSQFNGQVTNAAPGVKLARARKCIRGAGVQTSCTGTTVLPVKRLIRLQLDIEQEGAKEKKGAQARMDQHGVLSEPSQARPAGKVTL